MDTIASLLAPHHTYLTDHTGDKSQARTRAPLTRLLAARYPAWDSLRRHLFEPHHHPSLRRNEGVMALAKQLEQQGWIVRSQPGCYQTADLCNEDSVYLRGGWLEEYAWLAYEAAGCDEVYFAQKVRWHVGEVAGENELDVIARRGKQLSFASCKSLKPMATANHDKLRDFSNELLSWDMHFSATEAKTLLITTADLLDETRHRTERFPTIKTRAQVYDMDVLGLEDMAWHRFVQAVDLHWH